MWQVFLPISYYSLQIYSSVPWKFFHYLQLKIPIPLAIKRNLQQRIPIPAKCYVYYILGWQLLLVVTRIKDKGDHAIHFSNCIQGRFRLVADETRQFKNTDNYKTDIIFQKGSKLLRLDWSFHLFQTTNSYKLYMLLIASE